ncbi:PREDICTED: C-C chemokine receptor type 10 [Sturnus vulgaris]|uniref:C-C chemokine receptor type 10 n=1 Tax=Sturnus vulgaris TaxID=9172 RepID=UPI00071A24F7|nr:PREDICTED: C-C chemokine receptor type 10 [Sturnus vulgaris]
MLELLGDAGTGRRARSRSAERQLPGLRPHLRARQPGPGRRKPAQAASRSPRRRRAPMLSAPSALGAAAPGAAAARRSGAGGSTHGAGGKPGRAGRGAEPRPPPPHPLPRPEEMLRPGARFPRSWARRAAGRPGLHRDTALLQTRWPEERLCCAMMKQVTPSPVSTELMTTTDFYLWEDGYSGEADMLPEICEKQEIQGFARTFQPAVYLLLSLLGTVGNGLVLLTRTRYGQVHSITDVCLLHLALSDLLLLLMLPFAITDKLQGWSTGTAACRALQGLYALNFYSGFLFLTCISVDRYVAIVRVSTAYRLRPRVRRHGWLTAGSAWLLATLLALPQFIYSQAEQHQDIRLCRVVFPHVVSRVARGATNLVQVVLGFAVPFLVMASCYTAVARTLLAARGAQPHRALRVLLALVLVFVALQLPHSLMVLLDAAELLASWEMSCAQSRRKDLALLVTGGLAYLRCCLNPLLYAFLGQRFRRELWLLASDAGCVGSLDPRCSGCPSPCRRTSLSSCSDVV